MFLKKGLLQNLDEETKKIDKTKFMQVCVVLAILLIIIAFICFFEGISAGVFLFVLAIIQGMIVIIMWILQYSRKTWIEPMKRARREGTPQSESLND
jgi:cell division protein FtsW (lipid II flippase)